MFFIAVAFIAIVNKSEAQYSPSGFRYQTIIRDFSGQPLVNHSLTVRLSLRSGSATGLLEYQEVHTTSTDNYGLVELIVGNGVTTGIGHFSSVNLIDWSANSFFLQVSIDLAGGSAFVDFGNTQLFSVPYAFYAATSQQVQTNSLADYTDADTIGTSVSKLLKWNGLKWVPSKDLDRDTVFFASSSFQSAYSDTARYVYGNPLSDSVSFSYSTASSSYSSATQNTVNSNNAAYSNTAQYAFSSAASTWLLTGNTLAVQPFYIGTNDTATLKFRTNNIERVSLSSGSKVSFFGTNRSANFNSGGVDGLLVYGALGIVTSPSSGGGTKLLWYPGKASFRAGAINTVQWDTANIGNYSAAFGYNTAARIYSFVSGFENTVVDYSFASGRRCSATAVGGYPEGNSIALGDSCHSLNYRDVTIGKNNYTSGAINVLIGYGNTAIGNQSVGFGTNTRATGNRSVLLGYKAASNSLKPAFVYSDASSNIETVAPLAFQFIVRAAGGFVFYTDSLNTMGVMLASGSGSWSIVSDSSKKENFESINFENILNGINKLHIKSWNYKSQSDKIRHIGPMAQEFNKQFKFGNNPKMIETADMDGVILAGIKAINNRVLKLFCVYNSTTELSSKIKEIKTFKDLDARLDAIEEALNNEK